MSQDFKTAGWLSWWLGNLVLLQQSSSMWSGSFGYTFHKSQTSSAAVSMVSISMTSKALQGSRDILFYPFMAVSYLNFLRYYWFIECKNVCVCMYFFPTSSNDYPFVVHGHLLSKSCFYFLWCN